MKHLHALTLVCFSAPCWAQLAPALAPSAAAQATDRGEPNVKYTLIEDEGSKIDELRVRGQLQHVIVTPKVGFTKRYEIIVSRSGRDPIDGTGGANSALGKRVWNVLDF
jgi:Protein of unknown function (DUF2782)